MRIGTSYFPSMEHAVKYYKGQHIDRAGVQRKLDAGEIHIGEPPLKPGESLMLCDNHTRWMIDDGEMARKEAQATCPTCGANVDSVFDHVDGCPPEWKLRRGAKE